MPGLRRQESRVRSQTIPPSTLALCSLFFVLGSSFPVRPSPHNQARGRRVGIELAALIGDSALGSANAPADSDDLSLAAHTACLDGDRPQVVDLQFERCVANTGRE